MAYFSLPPEAGNDNPQRDSSRGPLLSELRTALIRSFRFSVRAANTNLRGTSATKLVLGFGPLLGGSCGETALHQRRMRRAYVRVTIQRENSSAREIPSLRILELRVVRFIPSSTAALATTPLASRRARRMASLSAAASVTPLAFLVVAEATGFLSSVSETFNTGPGERITALSIMFSNSRTFPGQCQ